MWKKRSQNRYTIVIGCGEQGEQVARKLADAGELVLVVDVSKEALEKMTSAYQGDQISGDATKRKVLDRIGLDHASAVVLTTGSENTNIMIAQLAKEEYHVPVVIARSRDPQRRVLYDLSGICTIDGGEFTTDRVMDHLISNKAG